MKKSLLTITICFFAFSLLSAQQDPKAKVILDALTAKTKSYNSLKAKFTYRYEDLKEGDNKTKTGNIIINKEKYKLEFLESVIFYDGKTMWNYLTEHNEVNITEPDTSEHDEDSFLENPQLLFNIYNKSYKYRLIQEYTSNNVRYSEIDLYPKELGKPYSRIKILVNKDKMQLHSVAVFGKDGINHLFTFELLDTNFPVKDEDFQFNKADHPGVEVIDLRL